VRRVEGGSVTLILGGVWNGYALHASDRQVSKRKRPSSPYEAHDRHSNKSIIVVAQDCWLVIGYSGLAFLDDKPTDQFIAEAVSQRELGGGGSVHFGDFRDRGLHYMEVRRRIVEAMTAAYSRLDRQARDISTTVLIAGVQLTKPRLRNILFKFSVQAGMFSPCPDKPKRHLPRNDWELTHVGTEDPAVLDVLARMVSRFEAQGALTVDYFRDILMDTIQEAAKVSDVVGDDVMGVILSPTRRFGQSYFRPGDEIRQAQIAQISTDQSIYDTRSISTPYVLIPGGIFEPSVASGSWTIGDHRCRIEVSGFQPEGSQRSVYLGGQHREPKP
jgi:hypothetical protein